MSDITTLLLLQTNLCVCKDIHKEIIPGFYNGLIKNRPIQMIMTSRRFFSFLHSYTNQFETVRLTLIQQHREYHNASINFFCFDFQNELILNT